MARLPQPGKDNGAWGGILNDFLTQSLDANGKLKANVVTANSIANGSVTSLALSPNTVTEAQLSTELQAKINSPSVVEDPVSGILRGEYANNTMYGIRDMVIHDGALYAATNAFQSGSDFSSNDWTVLSLNVGAVAPSGVLKGLPAAFTNITSPKGTLIATTGSVKSATYRSQHIAIMPYSSIRAAFGNWYKSTTTPIKDLDGPNDISYEVTWFKNGVAYPASFGGSRSITVAPGQTVLHDELQISINAGDVLYCQVYVSVTTIGMKWPTGHYGTFGKNEGNNYAAGGINLGISVLPSSSYTNGYVISPLAIVGRQVGAKKRSILLSGDSQTQGFAQGIYAGTEPDDYGYAQRVCVLAAVPYISIAYFGEQVSTFIDPLNRVRRMPLVDNIGGALCAYGWNDLKTLNAAAIEANLVTHWRTFSALGIPVWAATILPNTSSTDNWSTLANQTLVTTGWSQTERNSLNAWLRDGCPINSAGTPLAMGASAGSGVLRAGAAGHPLAEVFDIAAAVEEGTTGKWKVATSAPHYTSDGIHGSPVANAAMAATIRIGALIAAAAPIA